MKKITLASAVVRVQIAREQLRTVSCLMLEEKVRMIGLRDVTAPVIHEVRAALDTVDRLLVGLDDLEKSQGKARAKALLEHDPETGCRGCPFSVERFDVTALEGRQHQVHCQLGSVAGFDRAGNDCPLRPAEKP